MVSTSFASGGRGDDRTVHRTLAVGRYMLDMGYRSMVLANVSSIVIFQPPRVTVGKLFFALFAVLFGAAAGALFYGFSVTWILIGMIVGLVVGILPLIPKPPTSLMITGSDGGAAIFESNDLQFLQRAKAFLDARINQNDLAMTGFFDFTQSRFAPLRQEGEFEDMDQRRDMDQLRGEEPQDTAQPARAPARPAAATQKPARPAPRRESGHDAAAPARPPSRPQPQPAPTATPTPARPARPSEPALDADIDLSADDVTGHGGKDTGRGEDIRSAAAAGAREAHFEDLARSDPFGLEGDSTDAGDADAGGEDTLPPIDFTRVMPQLAHVRRFYDETLQDADAVDQLDTMIVLMEEGAVSQRSRRRILEIASTMQEQVETYPSIAAIFAGIASRVRI